LGRIFTGASVVVVGLIAGLVAPRLWPQHRTVPPPDGDAAAAAQFYEHTLNDADGRPQALSQWKGKLLVLNFWATWCAPCVAEMPALEQAQRELAARNVVIVGVGTEEPSRVREFRDRIGLHMNLLAGGYDALVLARTLGDSQGVLPYTVLISTNGTVLQTQTGPLRPGQLGDWLAAAP
jgi:peroxiredoxin